ncbi:MAG: helix-turn-helix transcriptional regulator [Chloroflexaceae bacterium]|nr:helix-turn-helix transcriptional regulator [Chloroflexaceae bacterium]
MSDETDRSGYAPAISRKAPVLRERHGMTQKQLAEKLGYATEVYVSYLENGKRRPETEEVFSMADLFGVTVDQLCGMNWTGERRASYPGPAMSRLMPSAGAATIVR